MYHTRNLQLQLILCLVLLAILGTTAHAQTTTPTSTPEEVSATPVPTSTPPAVTPRPQQTTLPEATQRRIINLAANISNRIDAATVRLTNISDRLDRRIKKLNDAGIDTAAAAAELETARAALTRVTNSMRSIDRVVYESTTSETPQQSWQEVRRLFGEAKSNLLAAKESLRAAIAALKAAMIANETSGVSDAVSNASSSEPLTN